MDSLTGDRLDQSNDYSVNLMELLSKKQGQNSKTQVDEQDSSLENNHSQSSNEDNENSNCDESENQKKKNINNSQSQVEKQSKQGTSQSSNLKQNSHKKQSKKKQEINIRTNKNPKTDNRAETQLKDDHKNHKQNNNNNKNVNLIVEEQKNENKKSSQVEQMGQSTSNSQEENNDDNQFETIEEEQIDGRQEQSNQTPSIDNYRISPFNYYEANQANQNGNLQNQDINIDEQRQNGIFQASSQFHPLQSLFPDIMPMNEQTRSIFNQGQNLPISLMSPYLPGRNSGLASLNSNLRREQRQQRRQRSQQLSRAYDMAPEGLEILSSESAQNQIRYFYCAALSLLLISCFLLYSVPSKNQIIILLILSILIAGLFFIFYKIKRIIQIRQNQIHENNYFSYRFTNPTTNYNEDIQNQEAFDRISNQEQSNPFRRSILRNNRNIGRQLGNMMLLNSIFSIFDQMHQQTISQDSGYTEEQIIQIGGAHKYDELKMLLKIQKEEQPKNQEKDTANENDDDTDCCIVCLEQLEGDIEVRILKCQHYFHQNCLDEWLKKKKECPVCRQCPLEVEPSQDQQMSAFSRQFPILSYLRPRIYHRSSSGIFNPRNVAAGDSIGNRGRQNMNLVLVYQ